MEQKKTAPPTVQGEAICQNTLGVHPPCHTVDRLLQKTKGKTMPAPPIDPNRNQM